MALLGFVQHLYVAPRLLQSTGDWAGDALSIQDLAMPSPVPSTVARWCDKNRKSAGHPALASLGPVGDQFP